MKNYWLLLFFASGTHLLTAQINAGNDDTVCGGNTTLTATVLGSSSPFNMPSPWCDDCFSNVINIGFPFTFYGVTYSQCVISSNNYISFNTSLANASSPWNITAAAPSATVPTNATLGPWQDIHPGMGGQVRYATVGTAPNRIFVVEYCNVPMFSCTNQPFTCQLQLHENGNHVETHITSKPICATWNGGKAIHALQNTNGTQAAVVPGRNNPMQWSAALEGYRFTTNANGTYVVSPVPFHPVVLGNPGTITWTTLNGAVVGTGNSITVSPTSTTTYIASMTDACSGQTFTDTVRVVLHDTFNFNGSATQVSSCVFATGTATVNIQNGSGAYTYQWDANANNQTTLIATGLDSGYYQVHVTDTITGCQRDTVFFIDEGDNLSLAVALQQNVMCNGQQNGLVTVELTGGLQPLIWQWNNGDTSATSDSLAAGTYHVLVTDNNLCTAELEVIITEPDSVHIDFTNIQQVLCQGGSTAHVTANATGGSGNFNYAWYPAQQNTATINNISAGNYWVTATDNNGCWATDSIIITQPAALLVAVTGTDVKCFGTNTGSAMAVPYGGTLPYSYNWTGGGGTLPVAMSLAAGSYTVTVTDSNGCTATANMIINEPLGMQLLLTSTPTECGLATGSASVTVLGGAPGYTYSWNNLQTTTTATNLPQGNISVTITDANGCSQTGSTWVNSVLTLSPQITALPVWGVAPLNVTFTNTTAAGAVYDWTYGDGQTQTGITSVITTHIFEQPGIYEVMMVAYNAGGCADTTWISIEATGPSELSMPNVFTPNGDGENDVFLPLNELAIREYALYIFDRWGKEVFSSNQKNVGWDGGDSPSGTYFYTVKAIGLDDRIFELKGSVTIFSKP